MNSVDLNSGNWFNRPQKSRSPSPHTGWSIGASWRNVHSWRSALLLVVSLAAATLSGCSSAVDLSLRNTRAPSTRLSLLDGGGTALSSLRGHPAVLVFWATSCPRSPKTLEKLNSLATALRPQGVRFIAVSLDKAETEQELREFIASRNVDGYEHAFSGNAEYDEAYISLRGRELPYVVVLNAAGTIVALGSDSSVVTEYFSQQAVAASSR